jgi:hypothetical protein
LMTPAANSPCCIRRVPFIISPEHSMSNNATIAKAGYHLYSAISAVQAPLLCCAYRIEHLVGGNLASIRCSQENLPRLSLKPSWRCLAPVAPVASSQFPNEAC